MIKFINVPPEKADALELPWSDPLLLWSALLLCEGNSEEHVGRPAMWRDEIPGCVHQNHLLRVRANRDLLDPEYVLAYMGTPPARRYFRGRAKRTTNLASINGTDVREFPLPVPPLNAQASIIAEVRAHAAERDAALGAARVILDEAEASVEGAFARWPGREGASTRVREGQTGNAPAFLASPAWLVGAKWSHLDRRGNSRFSRSRLAV